MNRRRFLAAAGTGVAALAGGYVGVRVDDVRPYDPDLPTGETPRERIVAAAAHRYAADHRARTTVRVERDGTGDAPYEAARYEQRHRHSRRRHLHRFAGLRTPPGERAPYPYHGIPGYSHWDRLRGADRGTPVGGLVFHTDGLFVIDVHGATPAREPERFGERTTAERVLDATPRLFGEFVRPHRASWTEHDRTDATVTYELSGTDAYSQVVPLLFSPTPVNEGSRLRATLDRETGRLRRLVDRRDLSVPASERGGTPGYRLVYRTETRFDRYGDVTVRRPPGADVPLDARLGSFVADYGTY